MFNISVIIPTLNRPKELRDMLNSLLKQSVPINELIIIDQSRDNLTKDEVVKLCMSDSGRHIDLHYKSRPEISGLAQARNAGIDCAKADILFFFDDDVILEEDYIESCLKVYNNYREIAGVGGVITNYYKDGNFLSKLFIRIFVQAPFRDDRLTTYINWRSYLPDNVIETNKLGGGLMSFKKEVFKNYKFDEAFYGCSFGEDIDFSYRVSKKHKLVITPAAKLYHKCLGEKKDDTKNIERQVCFWYYFFKKNVKKNWQSYLSFLWLYMGLIVNVILKVIVKKDTKPLLGAVSGFVLIRKKLRGCDFLRGGCQCL